MSDNKQGQKPSSINNLINGQSIKNGIEPLNKDFHKKFYPFVDYKTQADNMFKWVNSGKHILNAISNQSRSNDFHISDGTLVGKFSF